MPLIITLRTILMAAAAPISAPATFTRMPSSPSVGAIACGVRSAEQHRGAMARRMNGCKHGDIDVAGRIAKQFRRLLLAAGRHRVDVEEVRFSDEMRLDRLRRFNAGRSGDGGDNRVRPTHRFGRRAGAAHPNRVAGPTEFFARRGPETECPRPTSSSTPAPRKPDAMAWPASPKPMNEIVGEGNLALGRTSFRSIVTLA